MWPNLVWTDDHLRRLLDANSTCCVTPLPDTKMYSSKSRPKSSSPRLVVTANQNKHPEKHLPSLCLRQLRNVPAPARLREIQSYSLKGRPFTKWIVIQKIVRGSLGYLMLQLMNKFASYNIFSKKASRMKSIPVSKIGKTVCCLVTWAPSSGLKGPLLWSNAPCMSMKIIRPIGTGCPPVSQKLFGLCLESPLS